MFYNDQKDINHMDINYINTNRKKTFIIILFLLNVDGGFVLTYVIPIKRVGWRRTTEPYQEPGHLL